MDIRRIAVVSALLFALADASQAQTPTGPDPLEAQRAFSRSVLGDLRAGRFTQLDSLAASIRKTRVTFDSGAWKLWWFFDAFSVDGQAVQLGIRPGDLEKFIDAWSAATGSAASRVALAQFHYSTAWQKDNRDEKHLDTAAHVLETLDREGRCDIPCRFLQIEVHNLGGWSAPLRKVLQEEPAYWHAFAIAAFYLTPEWGGSIDKIEEFAVEAADATRKQIGDSMYMKAVVAAGDACSCMNLQFDWNRLRKGFEDFQALFPNSKINLNRFAMYAFKAADRETFRKLAADPLFDSAQFPTGTLRWASEPESQSASRPTSLPHVALTEMWTTEALEHPILFYFTARERFFGVSVASSNISRWLSEGRPVTSMVRFPGDPTAAKSVVFESATEPQLAPFSIRGAEAVLRERVAVIACRTLAGGCDPIRIEAKISGSGTDRLELQAIEPAVFDAVIGAPVIDDRGELLAVVTAVTRNDDGVNLTAEPMHHVMLLKRAVVLVGGK